MAMAKRVSPKTSDTLEVLDYLRPRTEADRGYHRGPWRNLQGNGPPAIPAEVPPAGVPTPGWPMLGGGLKFLIDADDPNLDEVEIPEDEDVDIPSIPVPLRAFWNQAVAASRRRTPT